MNPEEREGDRQAEATRTDRAGVEDREPVGFGDERHMRVTADDEIRVRSPGERANGREDARAIDAHVEEQDPQALTPAAAKRQDERVGEVGAGRIDVAAHDVQGGREGRELREDAEIADITGMQASPGRGGADEREGRRVRASVGIGHDGEGERPVGRELEDPVDPGFGRTHEGSLNGSDAARKPCYGRQAFCEFGANMRTWIVASVFGLIAATGCSASKADKCNKFFDKMQSSLGGLAGALGGSEGAAGAGAVAGGAKAKFVELCVSLPDDAIDCLDGSIGNMLDSKCLAVMGKLVPGAL